MIKKIDKPIIEYPRDDYDRIQFAKIADGSDCLRHLCKCLKLGGTGSYFFIGIF